MMRAVGSASPMMRLVAATAAFASVYFLVAVLTRSVVGDSGLVVLWPASGVYLGVMLVAPRRHVVRAGMRGVDRKPGRLPACRQLASR